MNPIELFHKDGKSSGVFYCEKCRIVYRAFHQAENCCQNYKCSTCGKDTGSRMWLVCELCRQVEQVRKERERFEKAEKIQEADYGDWIYDGDDFHASIDEMRDSYYGDMELPEYVWACEANHFVNACVDDITHRIADQAYEDWETGQLNGLDELKLALDKFNEANTGQISYSPDYTRAIIISKETA